MLDAWTDVTAAWRSDRRLRLAELDEYWADIDFKSNRMGHECFRSKEGIKWTSSGSQIASIKLKRSHDRPTQLTEIDKLNIQTIKKGIDNLQNYSKVPNVLRLAAIRT